MTQDVTRIRCDPARRDRDVVETDSGHPDRLRVLKRRCFAGHSVEETAEDLSISLPW